MRRGVVGAIAFSTIAIAVACGETLATPDESLPPRDAGAADSEDGATGPIDAGVDARCDPTKPFDEPVLAADLNSPDGGVLSARLTADELTAIATDGQDITIRTRTTPDSPFGAAQVLVEVSSPAIDQHASMSGDGLVLFFESTRDGAFADAGDAGDAGDKNLWFARRSTVLTGFGSPVPVDPVDTPAEEERQPYVTPDGRTIYFSRGLIDTGTLSKTRFDGDGGFEARTDLVELDVPGARNTHPVVTRTAVASISRPRAWAEREASTSGSPRARVTTRRSAVRCPSRS